MEGRLMPGMGMSMSLGLYMRQEMRLELSLSLIQALTLPQDFIDAFRTPSEDLEAAQLKILERLGNKIHTGEYFDMDHFDLEINRAAMSVQNPDQVVDFGDGLKELIHFYGASEVLNKKLIDVLRCKDNQDNRLLPGKLVSLWNKLNKSPGMVREKKDRKVMRLLDIVLDHKADLESTVEIVEESSAHPNQKAIRQGTFDFLKGYVERDTRLIPFAHKVLLPLIRTLKEDTVLDYEEVGKLYCGVVESFYVLDPQLNVKGVVEGMNSYVEEHGLKSLLNIEGIPIPQYLALEPLSPSLDDLIKIRTLFRDRDFMMSRERNRDVFKGFASLDYLKRSGRGNKILSHILDNSRDAKGFSRLMRATNMVYRDPSFEYPFNVKGQDKVLRNLKIQLTDKSIKRLDLSDGDLDKYLDRLESDDSFGKISQVLTTLAGYSHYAGERTELLREIAVAEINNEFNKWRYSHGPADEQLDCLGGTGVPHWKKNLRVSRLVGSMDGLESSISAVKHMLPNFLEAYNSFYGGFEGSEPLSDCHREAVSEIVGIEEEILENEEKLKSNLPKSEKKKLGYETSLLRERRNYAELILKIDNLDKENYEGVLTLAENIAKKRSKNPLYENTCWIRETLDGPAYQEVRRITTYETDDLEDLLRMGEIPVPHCQNWKVNSTYNRTLLSFVADANKKLVLIANEEGTPVGMSMVRLVDWQGHPTILCENIYSNEWSEDYGIALIGLLADKALAIHEATGDQIVIAAPDYSGHNGHNTNVQVTSAMMLFAKKYGAELGKDTLSITPPNSKCPEEYWDCGPGIVGRGCDIEVSVCYIAIGDED
jgi:hypothetical protein